MRTLLCGLLACFILSSCQKEVVGELGGGNSNNNSGLLSKVISRSGNDSSVNSYTYDAAKRIMFINTTATNGATPINTTMRIIRNSNGIITQTVSKDPATLAFGLDSIIMNIRYDANLKRYTSRVYSVDLFGFSVRDSTVLIYDASGRVSDQVEYTNYGLGYELTTKQSFVYSGNNISELHMFEVDPNTGTLKEIGHVNYTYDSKTSPLILKEDGMAIGIFDFYSSNNVTEVNYVDVTDASQNSNVKYTYTYNAAGKPVTATIVDQSGTSGTGSYIYL